MADTQVIRPLRLSPESRVSLASDTRLDASGITDEVAGGRYQLNNTAVDALKLLSQGLTLNETSARLAERRAVAPQVVFADLSTLLTSLDQFDLLVVEHAPLHRRFKTLLRRNRHLLSPMAALVAVQTFLELDWNRSAGRRYRVTLTGLVRAGVRAMRYAIVAGCVLIPLLLICAFGIAGKTSGVGFSRYGADLIRPILITIILLGASLVHELAHLLVLKISGVKVHYISARTSVIAIRHARVDPVLNGVVAIAGPTVACGLCLAATAILRAYHVNLGIGVNGIDPFVVVGILNLLTLNPWSADGRALWHALAAIAGKR